MKHRTAPRRWLALSLLAVVGALVLASCSDNTSGDGADATTTAPTTTAASTTAVAEDPQDAAHGQLLDIQQADAADVSGVLDYWILQISSKKPGLEADGIVYQDDTILQNHRKLVDRFGSERVALVWSGDFSTFQSGDFWVTVVLHPYSTPDEALDWCVDNGLDAENCNAKVLSHTRGISDGTARMN